MRRNTDNVTGRRRFLLEMGCAATGVALGRPAAADQDGWFSPVRPMRRAGVASGPAARRIPLGGQALHVIEGGREHQLADTVFEVTTDYPGPRISIDIGDHAAIDVLRIRLSPGVRDIRRFVRLGKGVRIGLIDVEAADQTLPHIRKIDGFVQIREGGIRIGNMRFRNIDDCVTIHRATGLEIGGFECVSYSRGIKIDQSHGVSIGTVRARVQSPHAGPQPGYNGITISDCTELDLPDVVIEDAAEHAIYLAGGGKEYHSENIRFGQVTTRRSGQCGIKCKSSGNGSVNVSVERLAVVDAAYRSKPGRNEDALRVEKARGFRIGRLEARREQSKFSCYAGIYLNGVTGFSLGSGYIDRPAGPLVLIEDSRGPNENIQITGLDGTDLRSHGYHLNHSHGQALTGLVVAGGELNGVTGDAVRIDGNARTMAGTNHIRIDVRGLRGVPVRGEAGPDGLEARITRL